VVDCDVPFAGHPSVSRREELEVVHDPDDLTGGELHVAKARAGQRDKIHVQMLTHWATIAPALRAWDRPERNPS
jgi:hypothetical protein